MQQLPLTFTVQKAIPVAQVAPNSSNVLPFDRRVRLRAKLPVTGTSGERSRKTVTPPLPGGTEGNGWSGPKAVIIDFPLGSRDGHAVQEPEHLSSEDRTDFTTMDGAAIALAAVSTAFYPALAWLFFP
jgi:hypothetical protein